MKFGFQRYAFAAGLLFLFGCSTDRTVATFDNPFDPGNGEGLPVPDSFIVTVGNNLVELRWGLPPGESADEYAIFRKDLTENGGNVDAQLVGKITEQLFQDGQVRNGKVYEYQIAAGRNGQFGERSEGLEARPGLFSIIVASDAPKTPNRGVLVTLSAPGSTEAVQLSESSDSMTGSLRPFAESISWTLSSGDGDKTLYARFKLSDGSESFLISDSIVLDTQAAIQLVDFDGAAVRAPGDQIHFRLDANESGGNARIEVRGLFDSMSLFDDGTNGDVLSGDGIYECDVVVPAGRSVIEEVVTGRFTDDVGNTALVNGTRTLTVGENPDPVTLLDLVLAELPDPASVTLRWTQSLEGTFSNYQIFRTETAPVDSSDRLVGTVSAQALLSFKDSTVVEDKTYFYRVYVSTSLGLQSGSNTISVSVPNLRAPTPVTLEPAEAVSSTSVALSWNQNDDTDFFAYRVYRNLTGVVSDNDLLVAEITDVDQPLWDDDGLTANTTYYYRIYVVDEGGLSSRSNEEEATTKN